ncbi:MAG: threonine ammonia-lyase [Candidatus Anammoxibacter sp.]
MIKLADIQNAQKLLKGVTNITPCDYSSTYSNITGGEIFLKLENLQRTGSFKARGAYCKIASLKNKKSRVITASGANQARAVAFAASKCDRKATVVMPTVTPLEKTLATKNYGAEVILEGDNFGDSYAHAVKLQKELGANYQYIHAFDDPQVIAGYGTIASEILDVLPDIQAIVVPVGGGGLISGIAMGAKLIKPDIKIIGVQISGSTAMKQSVDKNIIDKIECGNTIADGVIVDQVSKSTLNITKKYVDEIVVVDDQEIASVILMLLERSKLMVEGAGAIALTAALYGKVSLRGLKTAIIISGGNIDINLLAGIIEQGLIKEGRVAHIVVNLTDAPGVLSLLTGIIGKFDVNILDFKQEGDSFGLPFRQTKVDLKLEVNGFNQITGLLHELRSKGYEVETKSA